MKSKTKCPNASQLLVCPRNNLSADDNSLVASYAYDGLFRRATKTDATSTVIHSYYNNQWRVVEERIDASVNPAQVFYWGGRSRWELIRRDRDTGGSGTLEETLYCLANAMDPIAIINANGSVLERYDYTAFGVTNFLAPDYTARVGRSFDWNFLFHGEFRDSETGMYNYGYRFYDPQIGRWVSRDPFGERAGVNLYGFVENDPVRRIDFLGKFGLVGAAFAVAALIAAAIALKKLKDANKKSCEIADKREERLRKIADGNVPPNHSGIDPNEFRELQNDIFDGAKIPGSSLNPIRSGGRVFRPTSDVSPVIPNYNP